MSAVNDLLKLFRRHPQGDYGDLPLDSSTLMKTPKDVERDIILSLSHERGERTIKSVMSHILTNKLGRCYNWHGIKNKENFSVLPVTKVLMNIFVTGGLANQYEIEHAIREWLRRSGIRRAMYPPLENGSSGESSNDDDA
ncbi:hypothetical protein QAD02_011641 [Eretmocerus hayati]|uniref:Uncharacterized protein n=1 Tax=Eretmocerus hayati TaxID=131215 RepID=A0ACC2P256_9HYME|nr:hypothetical protein QAD02_011641 [Eretmocerus hayati]